VVPGGVGVDRKARRAAAQRWPCYDGMTRRSIFNSFIHNGPWPTLDTARQRSGIANIQFPGAGGVLREEFVVLPEPASAKPTARHSPY
jgi:hypothetical protein